MRRRAVATLLLIFAAGASAEAAENVELDGVRRGYRACRAETNATKRLACYDQLYTKLEPPSFVGSHTDQTPLFKIDRPTLLRYQSDGPIFVMYLRNEKGEVVQNLHIGGTGEAEFLVRKPGVYDLQVSATDTWRVWLEPSNEPHG